MAGSTPLGQNFLVNPGVAERIASLAPPGEEPVLEIGPGKGMLTRRLLERFPGRALTVVEKDPRLAGRLKEDLGGHLRVVNSDVLTIRMADLYPRDQVFLFGNIPYLISTPILEWVLFQHSAWRGGILMTQDEFARRLMEGSGPLPAALRTFFDITSIMRVSPGSFHPAPKVFSRIFTMAPREPGADPREFHGFLKQCFRRRRRSLRNNLREHHPAVELDAVIEEVGIPPNARAEALPDADLLALFEMLKKTEG